MSNHQGCHGFKSQVGKAGELGVNVMPISLHRGILRYFLMQVVRGKPLGTPEWGGR